MGLYIMLCTVHTTQGQGTMGLYMATLCTVYTTQGQDNDGFLYYTMCCTSLHRDRERWVSI